MSSSCLCGGTGVIYDWNKKGDPCLECSGQPMTRKGEKKLEKSMAKDIRRSERRGR